MVGEVRFSDGQQANSQLRHEGEESEYLSSWPRVRLSRLGQRRRAKLICSMVCSSKFKRLVLLFLLFVLGQKFSTTTAMTTWEAAGPPSVAD